MRNNEIDIVVILEILRKRWWAIVLCAVLGASIALSYSKYLVVPVYQSTALMYIDPKPSDQISNLSFETTAITYVKQIMDTNVKILTTRDFMQSVSNELVARYGEEEFPPSTYSASALAGLINVTAVEETKLFNIVVTCVDKYKALQIANVAKDLSIVRLQNIAEANAVTVADPPILPTAAANNNSTRNTIVGLLFGGVLCFLVLLFIEMFDVRIKTEEDFVNTYNIPLLGSVPNFERVYKTGKKPKTPPKNSVWQKSGSKTATAKSK